jgi:SAM-dependent methyltransferase
VIATDTLRRLNWGCGPHGQPGWLNSDIKVGRGIDFSEDIRNGLSIESDSLDYVVSIHALPMIAYPDLVPVLRELRRTLKPAGVLRLALPDLDKGIRAYLERDLSHFLVPDSEVCSLGGKFIVQMLWYGFSVSLFTGDFIEELLDAAGFEDVQHCGFRQTKSQFVGITDLDDREAESLFVEATKPLRASPTAKSIIDPATSRVDQSSRFDPLTSGMTSIVCRSREELDRIRSLPTFRHQRKLLDAVEKSHTNAGAVTAGGYCLVCDDTTFFQSVLDPTDLDGTRAHWTERLHCRECGLDDRQRAMYWFALQTVQNTGPKVYVAEQGTALHRHLRVGVGPSVVCGGSPGAATPDAVTGDDCSQDAPRIPFPDRHFDLVVSQNVLELVDEPMRVIDDIWRVLRPGGQLLLTVSFFPDKESHELRARRVLGEVVHYVEPVYRGNPRTATRELVFTDFGWELVDDLRESFSMVTPELYQSWQYGHLGPDQFFFRCIR